MTKYGAYNKKSKNFVGWLGHTTNLSAMRKRLKEYHAPSHVVPKKIQFSYGKMVPKGSSPREDDYR